MVKPQLEKRMLAGEGRVFIEILLVFWVGIFGIGVFRLVRYSFLSYLRL